MYVIIKKDGFYGWNPQTQQDDIEKLDDDGCVKALRDVVEIDEGVTFGDIIRTVDANELLMSFIAMYNRCSAIKEHHDFILNHPTEKQTDLTSVEVGWFARIWNFDGDNDLEMWTDAYGRMENGEDTHFGIDLTPANELKDLPVTINEDVKFWLCSEKDKAISGEGVILDDKVKNAYIAATKCFSLLEFLDALYEEISFFGPPGGREEVAEHLNDLTEEIKQQIDDGKALPIMETDGGMKVYMSDQVRDFLALPSNEEDRDNQISDSAKE